MFKRALRGRIRSNTTALILASALMIPAGIVAMTPSTAAAQGSDPLGPTLAQVQSELAGLQTQVIDELDYLQYLLDNALSYCIPPTRYCAL